MRSVEELRNVHHCFLVGVQNGLVDRCKRGRKSRNFGCSHKEEDRYSYATQIWFNPHKIRSSGSQRPVPDANAIMSS